MSALENRELGTVVWFNSEKGYGFLQIDGTEGKEGQVFVHFSDIEVDGYKDLKEGQQVSFLVASGDKGAKAVSVWIED